MRLWRLRRCSVKAIPLLKPQRSPCRKIENHTEERWQLWTERRDEHLQRRAEGDCKPSDQMNKRPHLDSPSTLVTVWPEWNVSLEWKSWGVRRIRHMEEKRSQERDEKTNDWEVGGGSQTGGAESRALFLGMSRKNVEGFHYNVMEVNPSDCKLDQKPKKKNGIFLPQCWCFYSTDQRFLQAGCQYVTSSHELFSERRIDAGCNRPAGRRERLQAMSHPQQWCTLTSCWASFHIQGKSKYTSAGGGEAVLLLFAPWGPGAHQDAPVHKSSQSYVCVCLRVLATYRVPKYEFY